ncbi:hypothetical protein GE061_006277 [Apolygus lucorum]|uniref:Uncharacterized protein n=1 Tax=Apolygus lucorum TaxID=248454 RepID=A0A8S9WUU1_APOLU|nr:hypothetical protein GE061_006277 [Apolygus lucorum]
MESFEELDGRYKGTLSPENIGFTERGTLNRNASFDLAKGCPKKMHVRTGSDYQKTDFWARVADQTTYIDSTRSSLLVEQAQNQPKCRTNYAGSNSTPSLGLPGARNVLHRLSVRETKRNGKITRFYSQDQNNIIEKGELRVHQPLLYDGSRTSLAAIWAGVDLNNYGKLKKPLASRKLSSWEERVSMERRRSLAAREAIKPTVSGATSPDPSDFPIPITTLAGLDTKDLRYCFQHPYLRLFTTLTIIFCNFLLFAEDPISHSRTEAVIPLVGNVFSFVCTKYPPDWRWSLIKVLMWIFAIVCGLTMGKIFIHTLIFGKYLRLKMFRDEQGSWIAMFLTVILSLYLFSHVYNLLLQYFYTKPSYKINSAMGLTNSTVMKAAACGTWLGDLITWLMVTDVMLQDSLYPDWAPRVRRVWKASNVPRILIFWIIFAFGTALVVTLIVSDLISWDTLNRDFVASTVFGWFTFM